MQTAHAYFVLGQLCRDIGLPFTCIGRLMGICIVGEPWQRLPASNDSWGPHAA